MQARELGQVRELEQVRGLEQVRDLGGERREDWPGLASWLGRQLEGWPRMLGGASVVAVVVSSRAS